MRVKERESWIADNVGKGGKKSSYSQFNKEFKGKERNPSASEFASMDVKEYQHYSANVDMTKPEAVKKNDTQQSKQSNNSNSTAKASSKVANKVSGLAKSIVSNVVTMVVGAVIVVNSYQVMVNPKFHDINWKWSTDYSTASLEFLDEEGTVINEIPAIVTITQENATCNKEGTKTFNATVKDEEGNDYSDTHLETITPSGHNFNNGKLVELEDGTMVVEYECEHCHEKIIVNIGIGESD